MAKRKPDYRTMICRCGEERLAKVKAANEEFFRVVNSEGDHTAEITYENLLSFVVSNLWWDYQVELVGMPTDMWSAVICERTVFNEKENDEDDWDVVYKSRVECDRLEDGLIHTYMHYRNLAKEGKLSAVE